MAAASPQRFGALDLLRGLSIALMIVVNNPGNWNSVFPQLSHAAWNGVTVADLVFPSFIFIMGVAMAMSLGTRGRIRGSRATYPRMLIRAGVLVLLGLVLNLASAWPIVGSMRIPGVLQRIGLTYLFAALIIRRVPRRYHAAVAGALLLLHWAVLVFPIGLAGSGAIEPGHNVGLTIDRALFGSHLLTPSGDPEGVIGLVSSVATALLGALVGRWLLRSVGGDATGGESGDLRTLQWRLAAMGAAWVVAGRVWSLVLPPNKALWTASFALLACGIATVSLVAFMFAGRPGLRALSPLAWLGVNPLAIYFLSELLTGLLQRPWLSIGGHGVAPKDWFYWGLIVPMVRDAGGRWSSLAYALIYTLLWIGVAGVLRWKRIRIAV